jgi:hypothetical protein
MLFLDSLAVAVQAFSLTGFHHSDDPTGQRLAIPVINQALQII